MNPAQVYTVVNAAAKQAFGETAVTALDTSSFIALGDKVLSSAEDTDAFNRALSDVIGRTIIGVRPYRGKYKGLIKKPFDYGAILRKIYVEVGDAEENPSWEISDEGFEATYPQVMVPKIKQHLFDKMATYEYGVTIPNTLWETAFHNPMDMAMLIDAIFMSLDMKTEISLDNMSRMVRAAFISRIIEGAGVNAINLLGQYNTTFAKELKAATAIYDKEFIRWSNMIIGMFTDRLEDPSRLFNSAGYLRHTPKEYQVLTVLSNYAKASDSYLQSDTYHQELVAMPYYNVVSYWQGSGTNYSFDDVSTVNVKLDANKTAVAHPYVLAVLNDIEALGITLDKPYTVAEPAKHYQFTDYWNKVNRGYFNDMSENGVVFYMADAEPTPEQQSVVNNIVKSAAKK